MKLICVLLSLLGQVLTLDNGVGKLPAMGYDTYNAFNSNFTGAVTIEQARLLHEYGLVDAGYKTFILDDYYTELNRSIEGKLVANKEKFPHGMLAWTNSIKKYDMTASAYSSNGYKTCAGYPGGYSNELQDLETWRSWGWTELIKYDNCYIPFDNVTQENEYGRYQRMLEAITQIANKYDEKPFIYSICQWGWQEPHNWAPRIANAWRIDADIRPTWKSISKIIDLASHTYAVTNHYQHGDLDMLEVGNVGRGSPEGNMTFYEQRTHFTFWALLKSSLLISTDLRDAKAETIEILGNREIIEINQDPHEGAALAPFRLGYQSDHSYISYNATYPANYWAGNSSKGPVFMIINTKDEPQKLSFDLTENWAVRAGRQYIVRDMWLHEDVGIAVRNWTVHLESHDVAALVLRDAGPEPSGIERQCAEPFLRWQCTDSTGNYILNGTEVKWGF